MIVMLSLPFALVGGLWLMWWLGFNLSVAVAVGFIALAGVAAETGVVMLIYLNQALAEIRERRGAEGRALSQTDLREAIMEGAVERVRPKMMTVVAIMAGLLPIMWSTGTGSEIMQRIAVPMIGGMISSTLLTLVVIPAIFGIVKGIGLSSDDGAGQPPTRTSATANAGATLSDRRYWPAEVGSSANRNAIARHNGRDAFAATPLTGSAAIATLQPAERSDLQHLGGPKSSVAPAPGF
jgi:predicted RND superfamily exporter protein